jgi:hypothetical protein
MKNESQKYLEISELQIHPRLIDENGGGPGVRLQKRQEKKS